ncbi:MAG: Isochorismatase family, partial [Thermomicrobiales bacterium]|nr:Isochorismatase family [Thermomicrobiales bacterium]
RDAADRGFSVTLAEDACSSWSEEMENAAIRAMNEIYTKVLSTEEIVSLVRAEIAMPAAM